jgi:hypothetical protein
MNTLNLTTIYHQAFKAWIKQLTARTHEEWQDAREAHRFYMASAQIMKHGY